MSVLLMEFICTIADLSGAGFMALLAFLNMLNKTTYDFV